MTPVNTGKKPLAWIAIRTATSLFMPRLTAE